jgi:hypothetical protein
MQATEGTEYSRLHCSPASKASCPYYNSSHWSQSGGNIFIRVNILAGTIILKYILRKQDVYRIQVIQKFRFRRSGVA